jgi:hypothetical protein
MVFKSGDAKMMKQEDERHGVSRAFSYILV